METGSFDDDNDFMIDHDDVTTGTIMMEFLMECCPPGTVPEPSILGSVMGLVRIEVLCYKHLLQLNIDLITFLLGPLQCD